MMNAQTDDINNHDINTVLTAIGNATAVLAADASHEMNEQSRIHLIEIIDDLTKMLASWYHIR